MLLLNIASIAHLGLCQSCVTKPRLLCLQRTGRAALSVRAPPLPMCPCCLRVAPLSLQAYYGLSLAMNDLAGSVYLNQFLGFVVEFPAYLLVILVIDRLGRRFAISWSMLIGEGFWRCARLAAWLATCPLHELW